MCIRDRCMEFPLIQGLLILSLYLLFASKITISVNIQIKRIYTYTTPCSIKTMMMEMMMITAMLMITVMVMIMDMLIGIITVMGIDIIMIITIVMGTAII